MLVLDPGTTESMGPSDYIMTVSLHPFDLLSSLRKEGGWFSPEESSLHKAEHASVPIIRTANDREDCHPFPRPQDQSLPGLYDWESENM